MRRWSHPRSVFRLGALPLVLSAALAWSCGSSRPNGVVPGADGGPDSSSPDSSSDACRTCGGPDSSTKSDGSVPSPEGGDPTHGILPSYDDAHVNWAMAGLQSVGGIPHRTTVCATVNPTGGGADDFTNIQNAINSCPAGQVVELGAGTFTVKIADLPIQIGSGIVLRGTANCGGSSSPYCQTVITVADGALAYTGGSAEPIQRTRSPARTAVRP